MLCCMKYCYVNNITSLLTNVIDNCIYNNALDKKAQLQIEIFWRSAYNLNADKNLVKKTVSTIMSFVLCQMHPVMSFINEQTATSI